MIPVAGAALTRELDRRVIEDLGVPGRVLMEIAGRGVAEQIHRRWPDAPVCVLCGPGNNGGDGYVIARWLHLWGQPVRAWQARPPGTTDAAVNHALAQQLGLVDADLEVALQGAAVAVDALLGTGQESAPRGFALQGMQALERVALRVAVDLPTGLHADTGQVLGAPVPAFDLTVTLGRHKPGLWSAPGHHLAGELVLVDIGLDLAGRADPGLATAEAAILERADIAAWLPADDPGAAKWNRGHVAVRAGGGAAVLAAHGAFRSGAGLVTLLAPRDQWPALHGLWPEVILAEPAALDPRRHDALVLGPGLGLGAADEVEALWLGFEGPVLADADALTVIGERQLHQPPGARRALTPHVAEAARLLGCTTAQVAADRFAAARALRAYGTVLLKGPCSLVGRHPAGADQVDTLVDPSGTVALATAGSGDVLAGLAGGYLARGLSTDRALAVAAWRHGLAGRAMPAGGTASDLVEALRSSAGAGWHG